MRCETTSLTYLFGDNPQDDASAAELERPTFAQKFSQKFAKAFKPLVAPRRLLFLQGALGVGKTEIARALIQELVRENAQKNTQESTQEQAIPLVPSPTFALLQPYETTRGVVLHADLYRLQQEQTLDLGLEEALSEGFVLIEWAERLHPALKARLLEQADLFCLRLAYTDTNTAGRSAVLTLRQGLATQELLDLAGGKKVANKSAMKPAIKRAFVLAAGLGTRMRAHTQKPKPLVSVGGKPLLLHAIERLQAHGVEQIFVNAHYRADALVAACEGLRGVVVLRELELLETGGGIARALPLLEDQPFFALNADALWYDPPSANDAPSLLACLEEAWQHLTQKQEHDATALLALIEQQGAKDVQARDRQASHEARKTFPFAFPLVFPVPPCEHAEDKHEAMPLAFRYIGVQILTARAFRARSMSIAQSVNKSVSNRPTPYSLTEIYAHESAANRLFGVTLEKRWRGRWLHVGDRAGLLEARRAGRRLGRQA